MRKQGQRKKPLTREQIRAVIVYLESDATLRELASRYGVHYTTILNWKRKYEKEFPNDNDSANNTQ